MLSADQIRANVAAVEQRIAVACARSRRERDEVILVAVSKTFPATAIDAAFAAGIRHVGENRVQEAREKILDVSSRPVWHLVGHLQSNKAKDAVRLFDMIESVDSVSLAEKIANLATAEGKRLDILLQVNIGREAQKNGIDPDEMKATVSQVRSMSSLALRGLMSIPPIGTPEETRRWFRALRVLRDETGLEHLSMGMSDDFEVAIEEGSTMIRVGRAIFGSRG